MIVVCDPVCWGEEHTPFDTALLETVSLAFPSTPVVFCAEREKIKLIQSHFLPDASRICWETIDIAPRHATFYQRWSQDFRLLRKLLATVGENADDHHLVLASCTPSLLFAFKLLRLSIFRNKNITVILHGGFSATLEWRSRNPFVRIQDLKSALTVGGNRGILYLTLEEPIKSALLCELPDLQGHVAVLDHPIVLGEGRSETPPLQPPFRFGFLGIASREKGFKTYLQVAAPIVKKYPDLARFEVVGWKKGGEQEVSDPASLQITVSPQPLPREQFLQRVQSLHFVCMFYQGRHYDYTPSGVLIDAIAWRKPIIALNTSIVGNLFAKFGDIGYLCNNELELVAIIEKIVNEADSERYNRQVSALERIGRLRTAHALAPKYRELTRMFGSHTSHR